MSCSCPSAMPPMRDVVSLLLFVLKSLSLQARQDIKNPACFHGVQAALLQRVPNLMH